MEMKVWVYLGIVWKCARQFHKQLLKLKNVTQEISQNCYEKYLILNFQRKIALGFCVGKAAFSISLTLLLLQTALRNLLGIQQQTGLKISKREFKKFGNSAEWRSLKHRVLKHMEGSSKRHSSAVKYKNKENYYKIGKKPQWRTN